MIHVAELLSWNVRNTGWKHDFHHLSQDLDGFVANLIDRPSRLAVEKPTEGVALAQLCTSTAVVELFDAYVKTGTSGIRTGNYDSLPPWNTIETLRFLFLKVSWNVIKGYKAIDTFLCFLFIIWGLSHPNHIHFSHSCLSVHKWKSLLQRFRTFQSSAHPSERLQKTIWWNKMHIINNRPSIELYSGIDESYWSRRRPQQYRMWEYLFHKSYSLFLEI